MVFRPLRTTMLGFVKRNQQFLNKIPSAINHSYSPKGVHYSAWKSRSLDNYEKWFWPLITVTNWTQKGPATKHPNLRHSWGPGVPPQRRRYPEILEGRARHFLRDVGKVAQGWRGSGRGGSKQLREGGWKTDGRLELKTQEQYRFLVNSYLDPNF